ncbi:MAG: hypothetical protein JST55_11130 [Bacteroidetes bacterium]|nr:hypothetical protein [Bacteroidota bacterium]
MIFEQLTNQSLQDYRIFTSHGNLHQSNHQRKFVPGGTTTDTHRARLRTGGILIPRRPGHLKLKS